MFPVALLQTVVNVDTVDKTLGIIALAGGMGFSTYRFGVKPMARKWRVAKEAVKAARSTLKSIEIDVRHIKQRTAVEAAYRRCIANQMAVGIFECDDYGSLVAINESFGILTGLTLDGAQGNGWLSSVVDNDRRRVANEWAQATQSAVHAVIYCTLQNRETKREHPVKIDADVIGNGNPIGWVCTAERTDDHVNGDHAL